MLTFNVDVFHWYVITVTGFAVSTALAGCREMQRACKKTSKASLGDTLGDCRAWKKLGNLGSGR